MTENVSQKIWFCVERAEHNQKLFDFLSMCKSKWGSEYNIIV